jgi:hypothetical protein
VTRDGWREAGLVVLFALLTRIPALRRWFAPASELTEPEIVA